MRRLPIFFAFLAAVWLPITAVTAAAQTNFGSVNIGASATSTVTLTVATAGTVASIAVVTQGATGLDFTNAGTGTCATETTYAVGATCTVAAIFKPPYAGPRYGAAILKDGSGNALATTLIYGIGTGPQLAFQPGTQTNLSGGSDGFLSPFDVAVDASGNVFVADTYHGVVKEILAAGGYTTVNTLGSGLTYPYGVAVDGSGNVFVTDLLNNALKEILAAGGYTTVKTLVTGFLDPEGVAVDGSGNVFVSDADHGLVKEILAAGGYTTVKTLGGEFFAQGLAVDGSGNVFVAGDNHAVKEILAEGGYTTVKTLGSGFSAPVGVAVDGSGNVYVADETSGTYEILAVGGYTTVKKLDSGLAGANGVAVDGSGNVYLVGWNGVSITSVAVKLDLADAPSLSFATTAKNETNADSPKTVQVENIGNEALTFTGMSYPGDFPEEAGDGIDPCDSSTSLSAGQQCNQNIDFTPQSVGPLSEVVTLTDNALNVSGAQQSISVRGTGSNPTTATLSATSLSFGNRQIGTASASQSVTLTNTGGAPLLISSIDVTGADASSFIFANNCGASVAVGASCTIDGHFAPTAAGVLTAAVTIIANATGSPLSIALSGTGYYPTTDTLSATSLAFGIQEVGTSSPSQDVTLTSTGSAALLISSISVDGFEPSSFIFANNCGTSLAPGASCLIHGHFTPTAAGVLTAVVDITANATDSPISIALSGTGTIPAKATLSATSLYFGNRQIGTASPSQSVTLTNTGGASLLISSIDVTGADASSFIFANNCGASVAVGASCTIDGHFAPTAAGVLTAAVTITANATGSPFSIALSGTGYNPPTATLSATSLAFGEQAVGTGSVSRQVILTNTGTTALVIASIAVTGADASSFVFGGTNTYSIANNCGTSLAAGASCLIHGHFTPTAAGVLTAAVTITANATGSPLSIALSGTGYNPTTATLSATSLSFGIQEVGTSSTSQDVTLTNTGNATLLISSIGVTGVDASSFIFANNCGTSLAAGASCLIHGHFTPTAAGVLTAAVTIADSASTSSHVIALSGTGYAAPTTVSLSATSIAFGDLAVGTGSVSRQVILTNTGTTALAIASIAVTGADASSFVFGGTDTYSIANSCGPILAAGASCLIHGHFAPKATGALTASVTIEDSATSSPQTIALTGTGYTATTTVSLSATGTVYGDQAVGAANQ